MATVRSTMEKLIFFKRNPSAPTKGSCLASSQVKWAVSWFSHTRPYSVQHPCFIDQDPWALPAVQSAESNFAGHLFGETTENLASDSKE